MKNLHKFTQIDKPSMIVSHYSSTPTPSQTLHIKYQRIHDKKAYTADEPASRADTNDDENEPIVIDFHYTDAEFDKYQVDKSLVNHAEFAELIASQNPDNVLNAGDVVKIIDDLPICVNLREIGTTDGISSSISLSSRN